MRLLRLALDALRVDRRRTATTLAGIAVGAASVCLTVAVAESVSASSDAFYDRLRPDVLTVGPDPSAEGGARPLDPQAVTMVRGVPGVELAAATVSTRSIVPVASGPVAVAVVGTDPDYFGLYDLEFQDGRPFSEADAGRLVCVVGSALSREMGVGRRRARVIGRPCAVVGVLAPSGTAAQDRALYIDRGALAADAGWRGAEVRIHARVREGADLDAVESGVLGAVRRSARLRPEVDAGVEVQGPGAVRRETRRLRLGVLWAGLFVTGLAVAVSMIGVANVMYASVEARVFEIGVRRAIGATRRGVVLQLAAEAGAMGLGGSVAGVAAAMAVASALGLTIPLGASAAAVAMGAVGGLCAGLMPALRAGRVPPVEALRIGHPVAG